MREYSKEDICKPKRTSNTVIYSNLLQSLVIFSNLPVPVTLPGTATACTVTARKEGRKEKCIYRCSNCIVVGYQFFAFSKVLPVQLEYFVLEHVTPDTSLTWVKGNTRGITFLATRRFQRINIHLQHRIVHIIVIYVFCILLKSYQQLLILLYKI